MFREVSQTQRKIELWESISFSKQQDLPTFGYLIIDVLMWLIL